MRRSIKLFHPHPPISGLLFVKNFIDDGARKLMLEESIALNHQIGTMSTKVVKVHKSQGHNLPFERHYKLIRFKDTGSDAMLNAQTFTDYGSDGHDLTYFMGNENIPEFIKNHLLYKVNDLEPVQELSRQKNGIPLNWRFTFNVYNNDVEKQAGFDWHKDIAANGMNHVPYTSTSTFALASTFFFTPSYVLLYTVCR
jgi:hypothetical protein